MHIQYLHIDEEIDLRMLVCVYGLYKYPLLIEFVCNFCMVQVACTIKSACDKVVLTLSRSIRANNYSFSFFRLIFS